MSTTVGQLVDRTFRSYLEPPNYQPASSRLSVAMDASTQSFELAGFDVPEDENIMRLGSIIEVGSELMRVTSFNVNALTGTVLRNQLGTTAAAHAVDDIVKLYSPFPRLSVFEAIRDNILALYDDLYTVKTEMLLPLSGNIYPVTDDLITELIEARKENLAEPIFHGRILDYHELANGRALILPSGIGAMYAKFRRRFGVASSEADTLESLGVEEVWGSAVIVGAAADMLAGKDIPRAHSDWVASSLGAEAVPIGTDAQLSVSLARYRNLLVDRFSDEMNAEQSYGITVQMANPFGQVTY